MTFKNEKELKKFLMEKCKVAIKNTQDIVYQDVLNQANKFYADYSPSEYHRTYQLNNDNGQTEKFISRSEIIENGNSCQADVHLDVESLEYVTGKRPTGEQVMEAATQGLHGAIGKIPNSNKSFLYRPGVNGVEIWDESLQEKADKDLANELIAQGLSVKRDK